MRFLLFIFLGILAPSVQAEPSALPFIASTSTEAELSAIGRIRDWRAGKGGCSAVLIAPRLAMTAAHCIVAQPRGSFIFDPTTLPNIKRMGVSSVIIHPDFEGKKEVAALYSDLAFLVLGTNVPEDYAKPIRIGPVAEPGERYAIYGFLGPDNPPLQGHSHCRIARLSPGVLGSDCAVGPGMSGSPLLAGRSPDWSVVGIIVGSVEDAPDDVRTLIAEIDRDLLPKQFYADEVLQRQVEPSNAE
ncbi:MAG: trypsin-like peptidase domain-containing protein [Pseudomonadota bacterium]